ncbi:MAG: trehalose-6-phosphate synthase [Chloroflexi bacterium]|nr:trehalose-6-phosphate synthase [Chloroflexota bacterium]
MTEQRPNRLESLLALCNEALQGRRLFVVSNRGPVEYRIGPAGEAVAHRGSGSLATSYSTLMRHLEFTWVASAMGEGDRLALQLSDGASIAPSLPGSRVTLRYVSTPRRAYHKFYNIVCNPILWFLQHYMWSTPYTPTIDHAVHDAWDTGYVEVNRAFADAVIAEVRQGGKPACIMLHDYHLYLVADALRQALPDALIQHYVHIPWPATGYWELLPAAMRSSICQGLCGADIVGFQTQRDVMNFLQSCQEFLPDSQVDYATRQVYRNGRRTTVAAYPLSINVEEVRRLAASSRARDYEAQLLRLPGQKAIVRIDRAEPNKNILRGFRAYEVLLQRHPELKGEVKFLAFLVPSRTHIRQFQRYAEEIQETAREMNNALGTPEWTPIHLFMENNYAQATAGMRTYDVLLVNPVIDGMNLVAKEGPVVNAKDGVLVISESEGAYPQLAAGALAVSPADIEGTMQAMYQALAMPAEERKQRSSALVRAVEQEDVFHWFQRQFEDVKGLAQGGRL